MRESDTRMRKTIHTSRRRLSGICIIGAAVLLAALLGAALSTPTAKAAAPAKTGDWPTFLENNARTGFNSQETIINRSTAPNLKLHWTHTATTSISSEPIVANGMIYWGSWDGNEHASSLSNGQDIWATNLGTSYVPCSHETFGITGAAAIATISIGGSQTPVDFVAGGNSNFYALNANTGAVIWQTLLGSGSNTFIFGSPAYFDGSIYIGVASLGDCPLIQGQFFQLQATTGQIQHTFDVVPANCLGGSVWGSPTIDAAARIVYFGTGNEGTCATTETMTDAVIALRTSDLSLVGSWQIPTSQQAPDGDFGSTPTLFTATIQKVQHKMLGLLNKNGYYYALDRTNISTGPLWQDQLAATAGPHENNVSSSTWNGKYLYAAAASTTINGSTCSGSLRALNPANGKYIWQDCLNYVPLDPAISVHGLVEIGYGQTLVLDNSATGKTLFTFQDTNTQARFSGAATISNGVLYQGSIDGNLYAFGT